MRGIAVDSGVGLGALVPDTGKKYESRALIFDAFKLLLACNPNSILNSLILIMAAL